MICVHICVKRDALLTVYNPFGIISIPIGERIRKIPENREENQWQEQRKFWEEKCGLGTEIVEICKQKDVAVEKRWDFLEYSIEKSKDFGAGNENVVQNGTLFIVQSHVFGKIDQLIEIIN